LWKTSGQREERHGVSETLHRLIREASAYADYRWAVLPTDRYVQIETFFRTA
jgi:hypothetical protein